MQNEYVGSWDLQSFEIINKENVRAPWGNNAHGLLIYTAMGDVSVSINKDPVSDASNAVLDSILFYSGTYAVNQNVVTHDITLASSPSRVGKEMIRYAELDGDLLSLSTPEESFGKAILVWKRRHL